MAVAERVVLRSHSGAEWEADIIERLSIGCCVVVRFTGRTPYPGFNNPATVCLKHLAEVRPVAGGAAGDRAEDSCTADHSQIPKFNFCSVCGQRVMDEGFDKFSADRLAEVEADAGTTWKEVGLDG